MRLANITAVGTSSVLTARWRHLNNIACVSRTRIGVHACVRGLNGLALMP